MFCCQCIGLIHLDIVCLGDCFIIPNKRKAWHCLTFNFNVIKLLSSDKMLINML